MNAEDMNKEPRGVGGWLLFFCFALVALGPPGTLENLHKMWEHLQSGVFPVVRQIAILETVGALLITVYGIVVGILIWRGSQRGRNLARQYLVIRATVALVLAAVPTLWAYRGFGFHAAKTVGRTLISATFFEIGICLIWWTYFTYSRRVRNTYGQFEN